MAVRLSERHTNGPIVARRRRPKLMEKFVIEGGAQLSGTMSPAGNKNGALPILASCVLTDDEVIVRNVPRIRDVEAMLDILRAIGVDVSWRGPNELSLCAAKVHDVEIDRELAESIRASFLLAGPLLARFHRAVMPPPGGDVIGRRRLDPHLDAFRAMGATAVSNGEIVLESTTRPASPTFKTWPGCS
jgi:UDP-N-acetylglucosamine 1-carboxyvinyltransferase